MKKLQEPTISFIISYAMVPNDLSGFVGLLLHCPPLSLKKVRFWKWINLGMELKKKIQRKHLHMFCLLSAGRAGDWPLTCGCSSQSTTFVPTSRSSTSPPYTGSTGYFLPHWEYLNSFQTILTMFHWQQMNQMLVNFIGYVWSSLHKHLV